LKKLAKKIKSSKYFVVYTGAGISTSAGIPDYRSPNGLHAMIRGETDQKREDFSLGKVINESKPTICHMALKTLYKAGYLKKVVTSNHDNLHLLSGINPEDVVELHGNNFKEKCPECKKVYYREKVVPVLGTQHLTGRKCSQEGCNGLLRDTIIRFQESLSEEDIEEGYKAGQKSDLALVLGTSLQVRPACNMPCESKYMVIVNLMKTGKDKNAKLIIHEDVDKVMNRVLEILKLEIDIEIGSLLPFDPIKEEEETELSKAKTLEEQIKIVGTNLMEGNIVSMKNN